VLTKFARVGLTTAAILLAATTLVQAETSATPASKTVAQQTAASPDFGSPPSGQIPILFNDHHVYTKPDTLKQGRVLAALVRGGTILLPLRSMFEQTGATVSYDPATKTADVSKPGADVKVTVGKPEVVINGESRPLDVAPIWYKGDILVPVRVIAEGMGAFVQWVPDKQVVVVRYLPPTPPPTMEPTEAPTVAPTVAPTPTPVVLKNDPFHYKGYVRAYDFYRDNAYSAYGKPGPSSKANQNSESNAISLHGDYDLGTSGFNVGATYMFAEPFQCSDPATHSSTANPPCGTKSDPPGLNPDDTLPGFQMSTLYEAYLQYKANGLYFKGGDQVINTPWAPASDSRLKPDAFQGADLSYTIASKWTLEASDYWEWECRTCSNFDHYTLLTDLQPGGYGYSGANVYPSYFYYNPSGIGFTNNGFEYGRLGYASGPLTANVYYYGFQNIANAFWLDGKYQLAGRWKPFLAIQAGTETNSGSSLLGQIKSTIAGAQVGFNVLPNVQITGAFNYMPWQIANHVDIAQYGLTCSAATHQISKGKAGSAGYAGWIGSEGYMLPASGTAQCSPDGTGYANLYYGGWASPYTESYATDPTFTASGTQSMIDRQSAGAAYKFGAVFTSDDRQLVASLYQTYYNYNNPGYATLTNATDVDTQYFFSHVPKTGKYTGFSLRVRLFTRAETNYPGASIPGLFKYSRFQAEYDF
jgi:hypothetical protein